MVLINKLNVFEAVQVQSDFFFAIFMYLFIQISAKYITPNTHYHACDSVMTW